MRLDGVEVKVNVDAGQTQAAVQALELPAVPPWQIFFIEDVTTGLVSSTPLLDQHLIIRARQKADGADDVTVKFRPGRRSQLGTSLVGHEEDQGRRPRSRAQGRGGLGRAGDGAWGSRSPPSGPMASSRQPRTRAACPRC